MSSKSERERLMIIASGSPLAKHSMNQDATKRSRQGERRLGIEKQRTQSEFWQSIEDLKSDDLFIFFVMPRLLMTKKDCHSLQELGYLP